MHVTDIFLTSITLPQIRRNSEAALPMITEAREKYLNYVRYVKENGFVKDKYGKSLLEHLLEVQVQISS